ncbi:hypothetical protein [Allosphingosinicella vermicomposti]|uniref:hypothetical protein n=1 Tax=Allosphingosinicella vermicomposti TaxID=614671 RepID=UPI000D0F5A05|nr:hypothetical protein [Allosphingosinicella vermicomposti]
MVHETTDALGQSKRRNWPLYLLGGILLLGVAALFAWPKDNGAPADNAATTTLPDTDLTNVVQAEEAAQQIAAGTFVEWSAAKYPEPVTFQSGEIRVRVSSVVEDDLAAPEVTVSAPGMNDHVMRGEAAQPTATHRIGIGRLNPQARIDHVILASYSGGAHCCTAIQVAVPSGDSFVTADLGEWDGEGISEFPRDLSGDGTADFILYDNAFLYAFTAYAFSEAPPAVYNLVGAKFADVSRAPAFRPLFAKRMTESGERCRPDGESPRNGACAAFVASAARIGRFDEAWAQMLRSYENDAEWDLPTGCRVSTKGECPEDQLIEYSSYPEALRAFLIERGYLPTSAAAPSPEPPGIE